MKKWLFIISALVAGALVIMRESGEIITLTPPDYAVTKTIPAGSTFAQLAVEAGLATDTVVALLEQSKDAYDLATIVSGRQLAFIFDAKTDQPKKVIYKIDSERQLLAQFFAPPDGEPSWEVAVAPIAYEVKRASTSGVIETSLYEAMVAAGSDERLVLALAEAFAWQIDFAADIRTGDSFKVVYEERYLDGEYAMPGKILAAEFTNDGKAFKGYYFGSDATEAGHYDEEGNSLQKVFLKSPLQYKYISSGYSYSRVNPITKKVSSHRGIDYAANYGTPAVSVGDGTVVQAGWNGPYGISVLIRHNDTYQTRYGHFQSLARGIRVGAKVKQGQVVGYVGSTGQSTGPHLHYEMHKFGSHVNPFLVEVPPGEPITDSDREAFTETVAEYEKLLARL